MKLASAAVGDPAGCLDLTFLSTGAWQHVFVSTRAEGPWVYKIPTAFGSILPLTHRGLVLRANELYARAVLAGLVWAPRRLRRLILPAAMGHGGAGGRRARWSIAGLVDGATQIPPRVAGRLLAPYLRRTRRVQFAGMLDVVEYVHQCGLADALMPCAGVRTAEAVLRVDGGVVRYKGPLLIQRRAVSLLESADRFFATDFDWGDLVHAQLRLWRRGVTVRRAPTLLGIKGWALLDGRLRLFDTSGLTRDPRIAQQSLRDDALDRTEQGMLKKLATPGLRHRAQDYFRFVRATINPETFDALWRVDVPATQAHVWHGSETANP